MNAMAPSVPQVTLEQFETEYRGLHLLHAAVDHWAARRPGDVLVINATRGTRLTWAELQRGSMALAGELARRGFRKGDFLAASLPMLNEHILLQYACFRLGVIHAPLDLRLQPAEVLRSLALIRARGYVFLGKTPAADFSALGEAVRQRCDFVEHFIQFAPPGETIPGAVSFAEVMARAASATPVTGAAIDENDGAQVIFTTGSTGSPKPALLSHRGISCQNLCLGCAFGFGPAQRVLCNLPASHVGGQAESLMTCVLMGGVAVTLEIFDAVKSLEAIEKHGVTLVGQIPAMFNLEWQTGGYERRDLSTLRSAIYGGQAVPRPFLERMLRMAPAIATGLGLTETSGFCTYTALTGSADAIAGGVGWAMPAYPMSIRQPMQADGSAGAEMPAGGIGHVCFRGPQNFLGYVNDPAATAATLAPDGWLYTGDMGVMDHGGLRLAGRAKWVLKPSGYQVFPGDVENHIGQLTEKVASVGVVGHAHNKWSEGIIAFVEKRAGADLSEAELRRHARSLTSYMRPLHYVILEPGVMPLNRTAKVDVTRLQELAKEEVRKLRERGRWDGEN
jgi:acyl-CoA synthetase (AMP-forming)/AMP-acid ligase II